MNIRLYPVLTSSFSGNYINALNNAVLLKALRWDLNPFICSDISKQLNPDLSITLIITHTRTLFRNLLSAKTRPGFLACIWHTGHVCSLCVSWLIVSVIVCRDSRVLGGVGSRLRTGSVHFGSTARGETTAAQRQSPAGTQGIYTRDHD